MSDNIDKELEEIKRLINTEPSNTSSGRPQSSDINTPKVQVERRQSGNSPKNRRKKQNKKVNLRLIVVAAGVVLLFLVLALVLKNCTGGNTFEGTWDMDGTTVYQFDPDGRGAMILPSNTYSFSYLVDAENKSVSIDFDDERATDYTYSYRFEKNKLILFGTVGKESFSYEFTRLTEE